MIYSEENYKNAKSDDVFDFTCPVCGVIFHKTKRQISKNKGEIPVYCSQRCFRVSHQAKKVKVICEQCGSEYEISKYEYERKITDGEKFFCSRSCSAKYNNKIYKKRKKTSITEICPICGNKKSGVSSKCKECRRKEQENYVMGRELGYYIGYDKKLAYITRRCTEIRKVARKIIENEPSIEKVCYYCKNHDFDEILEVHHIKPISDFDPHDKVSQVNSLDNLVWLCPNHHRMLEKGLIKLENK